MSQPSTAHRLPPTVRTVRIGKVTFQNPILLASGTFGFGLEFPQVVRRMGGIVSKGITRLPRAGNPPPRVWEVPGGIINSVGLENPGADEFARRVLPEMIFGRAQVLVNVAGDTVEDYAAIIRRIDSDRIAGFELNVSCPNVKEGGAAFGQNPKTVARIVRAARRATRKLLVTKLTANFIDPVLTARAAEAEGTDAVSLINTVAALALDAQGGPALGGVTGGLSGPAIKPFALYCVRSVASGVRIPVVGGGGITSGRDVIDFLHAGARLVQIGSVNLVDPYSGIRILDEFRKCLADETVAE
jgi:dihydroorotate dehydrogenase (NAD+) catalytic subunit